MWLVTCVEPIGNGGKTMRILIRMAAWLSPSLAPLARRRLEFALGRCGGRVRSLTVRLADLNGPRGSVDKHCLVAIRLTLPRRLIVIQDTAHGLATLGTRLLKTSGGGGKTIRYVENLF